MLEHLIQDVLQVFEALLTEASGNLLIETKVLEPDGTILLIVIKSLFTDPQGLLKISFSLLISRSFKENRSVSLAFLKQISKLLLGLSTVAKATLKES